MKEIKPWKPWIANVMAITLFVILVVFFFISPLLYIQQEGLGKAVEGVFYFGVIFGLLGRSYLDYFTERLVGVVTKRREHNGGKLE